ncbi:MAG: sigma-70 family RNA polymerase sigma factor [Firmicutes bacterium]|nr:sigma-70 family RNA polymerase sigma factor [Bacillota bacterium]
MDFKKLYTLYADSVYSYIYFKIKDRYLAEDILQETFLAVYNNLNHLPAIRSPKAWLLAIAQHKIADRLRKEKNQPFYTDSLADSSFHATEQIEENLFLEELLQRLDETSRQIIYGIYVEQLSYKELAAIFNLPEGTVKSKAYYARAKLKRWLEADKDGI